MRILLPGLLAFACALQTAVATAAPPANLKSNQDKASYIIGNNIGENIASDFKDRGFNINPEVVAQGILNGLKGGESGFTDEEAQAVLQAFLKEAEERLQAAAQERKKQGQAFLVANAKKEGVKTTNSGLQYKVIQEGNGATPKENSMVTVHYSGKLLDGTEFDSSYARQQPAQFPVNGVIAGWTEALQLMKAGGKMELYIPSELAYGENPPPGSPIPPNSVLLFTVELLDVKDAPQRNNLLPPGNNN